MKFSKLMQQLNDIFDSDERQRKHKRKDMKAALKKIRNKQRELEQKLENCDSKLEAKALQEKIYILTAQRIKGVEFLKSIKKTNG